MGKADGEAVAACAQGSATVHNVPFSILWGVLGLETSWGTNISTSSAGAKGIMQFIQSTAAKYGYPYNNNTDSPTICRQIDLGAKYLHDLYVSNGNDWNSALHSYSGGGYGLSEVQAKGTGKDSQKVNNEGLQSGVLDTVPGARDVANAVTPTLTLAKDVAKVLAWLTSPEHWLRVGEILLGAILAIVAVRTLLTK